MTDGRTKKSIVNLSYGIIGQAVSIVVKFLLRTVFIYKLGKEYLGLSGLFTNIISILSLAELGVGVAIVYALYKPIADNNEREISALMRLYKKTYSAGLEKRIVYVDRETGVNYLYIQVGYGGGLTPLLDVDGKPVITRQP